MYLNKQTYNTGVFTYFPQYTLDINGDCYASNVNCQTLVTSNITASNITVGNALQLTNNLWNFNYFFNKPPDISQVNASLYANTSDYSETNQYYSEAGTLAGVAAADAGLAYSCLGISLLELGATLFKLGQGYIQAPFTLTEPLL
jgi:hypothetical protein